MSIVLTDNSRTQGWQGVLPQALEDLNYSETESGWLGFGTTSCVVRC
jgi:hypothetical protein